MTLEVYAETEEVSRGMTPCPTRPARGMSATGHERLEKQHATSSSAFWNARFPSIYIIYVLCTERE